MAAKKFDVIVIGAGSGLTISSYAANHGLTVAVIEEGPFGGTCLNRGCIPSKMFIHSADVMETIKNAETFGITAEVKKINWKTIQRRVWKEIDADAQSIETGNKQTKNITVYKGRATFIDNKTLAVGKQTLTGDKIFICAGTRPRIPKNIKGLDSTPFFTSDNVMRLQKQPKSMIIIGGGYIGVELGYFFSALGTNVTILDRSPLLIKYEDHNVAKTFTDVFSKKVNVLLHTVIRRVAKKGKSIIVDIERKGKKKRLTAETLFIAAGRVPNTDILALKNTSIKTNKQGFITVDKYMETSVNNVWAIGDIAGIYLFKHSANLEASYCAHNAFNPKKKVAVDYTAMPHAIFSSPQIAGVGKTEQELKKEKRKHVASTYRYKNTGMGAALAEKDGFVKVLVDPKNGEILGCHIMGPDATTLLHEVLVAMKHRLGVDGITQTVHIHPALPEVVQRAFSNL